MKSNQNAKNGLPRGWIECSIGQITLSVSKIDPKEDPDREIIYIDIASIDNNRQVIGKVTQYQLKHAPSRARQIVRSGDVLFATVRPYLRNIASVSKDYDQQIASTGFSVLRPAEGICPTFLFYKVISRDFVNALAGIQYGVSYPAVKDEQVRDQLLWLPPLPEQRRIVAKIEELFSELDKGIESLKAAQARLNVYRQAVLKYAFEGMLTTQWREENKDKLETPEQLLARIKQEREARYERQLQAWKAAVKEWEEGGRSGKKPPRPKRPTEAVPITGVLSENLPPIPACWEWLNLKHIGRVETGTTPSTKYPEYYGGKLPFFKPTDLDQGAHVRTARDYLSQSGEECARVLPAGSTLVTCIGATIGKTGFAVTRCATNQQINSISPYAGFNQRFVYLQMVAPFLNERVRSDASATTLPILNKSKFCELPFVFCSLPEQHELVRLVEERFVAIERSEREIDVSLQKARSLRQSILKKAFSGQLVPQDPDDEPASVLLDRIKAEKTARSQKNTRAKRKRTTATT